MFDVKVATFTLFCFMAVVTTQVRPPGLHGKGIGKGSMVSPLMNLATNAKITVNATCGERRPEKYCKLVEHVNLGENQCGECNARSFDHSNRHPIGNAIDGSSNWWQSPSIQNGMKYHYVTIDIDLKQLFQVAYIIIKFANSPRPGNWILERSLDGKEYKPWQYYAINDVECLKTYGITPTTNKPSDNEVICTSSYSKLNPLEGGEIHTSLVLDRPGVNISSQTLRDFTTARHIRIRLQKIRTLNADLMMFRSSRNGEPRDPSVTRRARDLNKYYYSIKDISVGGMCACQGHARECPPNKKTGLRECRCLHNTCGSNCGKCCPMYNQIEWSPGKLHDNNACQKCECNGRAIACIYNQTVAANKLSVNTVGRFEGGGVCVDCKDDTMGINCEQCADGFYRPSGVLKDSKHPCKPCGCDHRRSTGTCVKDDSRMVEGVNPGDCVCKAGFTGPNCDRCTPGYKNYPRCEPCSCHYAGTDDKACNQATCKCKVNVEGRRCDRCKPGTYYLNVDNPEGCDECFCFGVTDKCESSELAAVTVKQKRGWTVTNIAGDKEIPSMLQDDTSRIAHDEVDGIDTYYWKAPPDYLGRKIQSYGGKLKFVVGYAKDRGDTAGVHIDTTNVIIEGNGMMLGYGGGHFKPGVDNKFSVTLSKNGWYLLSKSGNNLRAATKADMMNVLSDVDRLLVRAKYHTDQIEGILNEVAVDVGSKHATSKKVMKGVEKCDCPPGYTGLSCEDCSPGYRKDNSPLNGYQCVKCDCNNHAERCDPGTGACINCLHHTTGPKCDRCEGGYYGDATRGKIDDCKPCACLSTVPLKDFTPTCIAVTSPSGEVIGHKCVDCPKGYMGDKCQRCDDGYFGNPLAPGNYCQPCDCSGNVNKADVGYCDSSSGKCLKCLHNTDGWKCDKCKHSYYGNALEHDCRQCNCELFGSQSQNCDKQTGQCKCRPNFTGNKCDRCADGYGNVAEKCQPCSCNPVGSKSRTCNPVSGLCDCKPGVFGSKCDSCMDGHYGFSAQGCQWCGCDPHGSNGTQCDEITGQCRCKTLVVGRPCDRCTTGYWGLRSENGCKPCNCNATGSISPQCDDSTGRCECKPGVGGAKCDRCLPGYFGWSYRGCRKCAPCDQPGHLCHPKTGQCVCPPNTRGDRCQYCMPRTWGHDPLNGCQPCDCEPVGSVNERCDARTGTCKCLEGVKGEKCDKCRYGYYNFPRCRPCNCNEKGTNLKECRSEKLCQCDERGQCPCKDNTQSRNCGRCKAFTFGLTKSYNPGCFDCFCYGKSLSCVQAQHNWGQISISNGRQATIDKTRTTTTFNLTNGLRTIPEQSGNIRMGVSYQLDSPLYWALPKTFLGDKSLSYNGMLKFKVKNYGRRSLSSDTLQRFPLVQIQGNWRLILQYHTDKISDDGYHEVRLREDYWRLKNNERTAVTRAMMMVTLQNLQHFLIRATTYADPQQATIERISLQVAEEYSLRLSPTFLAKGVEICQCPKQYVGVSCQDPAEGYYRKRKKDFLNSKDILDLVGTSVPCECNGRSEACDKETGVCINCRGNTTGSNCERCAPGFYGNPAYGPCKPCTCPLVSNSFSDTCVQNGSDYYCTNCQPGYTGRYCHRCADGYYGDPLQQGGRCLPCACDRQGSISAVCNKRNGQCRCKEGITGRDCTKCKPRYVVTEKGCESCDDECTGLLLNDIDYYMAILNNTHISGLVPAPWQKLWVYGNRTIVFKTYLTEYVLALSRGQQLINNFNFDFDLISLANLLLINAKETANMAPRVSAQAKNVYDDALKVLAEMEELYRKILDIIDKINSYGIDSSDPAVSISLALEEAEKILLEIKTRDFDPNKDGALRELRKARNLLDRMKKLMFDENKLDILKSRLSRLRELIRDLVSKLSNQVKKPTEQALMIMRSNRAVIDRTQAAYNEARNINDLTTEILAEGEKLIKEADELLRQAKRNFQVLPGLLKNLIQATRKVRKRANTLARLNPIYKKRYVIPAQEHAANLMRQAAMLSRLFKATQDISEYPLRAAKVYRQIVDALIDAMAAAKEASTAADNAYGKAFPDFGDSLVDRASRLKAKSQQLLEAAKLLRDKEIPYLQKTLTEQLNHLDLTDRAIRRGFRDLQFIDKALDGLPIGTRQALLNAIDDASAAGEVASDARNRTDIIVRRISEELVPKLRLIQAGSTAGLGNISRIIDQARRDIKASIREANNLDKHKIKIRKINDGVKLNLDELKAKILQARQTSSTIRISLSTDDKDKCMRSYVPEVEAATTNRIVATYSISTDDQNALLFYIGSDKSTDFMALEMVQRKIRFSWNAGGKQTGTVQHNLKLATNDPAYSANSKWYKIEVNRFGNVATLSVQPSPEGALPDRNEVTGSSTPGYSLMDLTPLNSRIFVGSTPSSLKVPSEVKTNSFAGCLFELKLDDRHVGLWNFKTNDGCSACKEGASEVQDVTSSQFKGSGYASLPQIYDYHKKSYSIALHFRTFDENALLFFSPNKQSGDFVSIELRDGKIVHRFKIGKSRLVQTSRKKYNTGNWTKVIAERLGLQGLLSTPNELLDGKVNSNGPSLLDLKHSRLYFGGVPPTFNKNNDAWKSVTFSNFLGCMKGLQMDTTPLGLFRGQTYDVDSGCTDQPIRVVSFENRGYIEVDSHELGDDSSLAFSFSTKDNNGLILLSTFDGKQGGSRDLKNYYSVAVVNGKLTAKFNGGSGSKTVTAVRRVNDGNYHQVSFVKKRDSIVMRLDDELVTSILLDKSDHTISSPSYGGLYFGGVPSTVIVNKMSATDDHFNGNIKDAVVNNKVVAFNQPRSFKNANVGRAVFTGNKDGKDDDNDGSSFVVSSKVTTKTTTGTLFNIERCAGTTKPVWEARAVKFGDSVNSQIEKEINKKLINKDFTIKFDFRTFYPNGMLLMMRSSKRVAYLVVYLKDGKVNVEFRRKSVRRLKSTVDVNNGRWKSVTLWKKGRKLHLKVGSDGEESSSRVGKRLYLQEKIYVGNFPKTFAESKLISTENFKGCVRNFQLNGRYVDLASGKVTNVGQCFSKIERGSYFGGDAYATHSKRFVVGQNLQIELEFRTVKLYGILLSVSHRSGSPGLSLELHNGNITLNVDMGYRMRFGATVSFKSKYTMCDNKWHRIRAVYGKNMVKLKVDDYKESFGFSELAGQAVSTNDPLYIGGLPDGAPQGILGLRDNFVGCLRNVKLNNKRIDWINMAALHNVLPNSCPKA